MIMNSVALSAWLIIMPYPKDFEELYDQTSTEMNNFGKLCDKVSTDIKEFGKFCDQVSTNINSLTWIPSE